MFLFVLSFRLNSFCGINFLHICYKMDTIRDINNTIDNELINNETFGNLYETIIETKAFLIRLDNPRATDEYCRTIISNQLRNRGYTINATNPADISFNTRLLCDIKQFNEAMLTTIITMNRDRPDQIAAAQELLTRLRFYDEVCGVRRSRPSASNLPPRPPYSSNGGKKRKTGKKSR